MDGHFFPTLTFGPPVIKCLRPKLPDVYLEAHMIVQEPEKWIRDISDAGVQQYTFHYEACPAANDNKAIPDLCRKIKESGMRAGIALKPSTPAQVLLPLSDHFDAVLIMTGWAGPDGQRPFLAEMTAKVKLLRQTFPWLDIGVDGGVGPQNIDLCAESGANMIVSGSAVTGATDPARVISQLRSSVLEKMVKYT